MAHPDTRLPVDESVQIPASVRRAAEAANALHAQVYDPKNQQVQPPADPPVQPVQPQPEPPVQPVQPVQPQVQPPVQPDPVQPQPPVQTDPQPPADDTNVAPEEWRHRYLSMKGRFDQSQITIGSLQQQMSELGDELVRLQEHVQRAPQPQRQQPQPRSQPRRLLTDQDVQTYGPELLDVIQRAAREAVAPDLQNVAQQTQQVNQRVVQNDTRTLYSTLDAQVPDWRAINVNPRFKMWCRSQDVYSGQVRGALLNAAFKAADAPRVVAFFKGFQNEEVATGNAPNPQPQPAVPPRQAAVDLGMLTAPGRAKPATGDTPEAADKPIFTRAQISAFYSQQGRAAYVGREADRKADEALIFQAQREGRVRG